jgi:hypothetical protein
MFIYLSYPFNFSEDSEKVESRQFLEVVQRPSPAGQKAGEQGRIFGNVFETRRSSEIEKKIIIIIYM